jgi:hypothetical protein
MRSSRDQRCAWDLWIWNSQIESQNDRKAELQKSQNDWTDPYAKIIAEQMFISLIGNVVLIIEILCIFYGLAFINL